MPFEIVDGEARLEEVRALFSEYAAQLCIDLGYQDFATELVMLPGKYARPQGRLFLALADGVPAGCAAMRKLDASHAEMKRLFVKDSFRGRSLGRALANAVVQAAKESGYQLLLLDTLSTMTSAQTLYRELGFTESQPYYDCPVAGTVFMQLVL
jgi:ribosomal protein S18 acetylase RimI-like enzyme